MNILNILNLIYSIFGIYKIPTIELCKFIRTDINVENIFNKHSYDYVDNHIVYSFDIKTYNKEIFKEIPINCNLVTENYKNNTYEYKGKLLPKEFFIEKDILPNELSEKHLDMIFEVNNIN